jgi:hypothetical protein
MPHIPGKRYAVVSCHVERPLDDACWARFADVQARRPGGFRIAALLRPPDRSAGEDEERWLERAREAAGQGPIGHHTHFVSSAHARPDAPGPEHAERVRREAAWLRSNGLHPTLFCAGGWYMDVDLAEAIAGLGYADCTATAFRPGYLAAEAPRIGAGAPVRLLLPSGGRLVELPSTHSLGMAARGLLGRLHAPVVHVYFHDTDLLSRRRRTALAAVLEVLGRRRTATDLERLIPEVSETDEIPFQEAFRGGPLGTASNM